MKPVAIVAACALLLLAAFGVWRWLGVAPEAPCHERDSEATPPPASASAPGNGAPRSANDSLARTMAADSAADGTVHLVVVNAADEPVANADVRYWPPRSNAARAADITRWNECGDLEVVLKETGVVTTTDAHGRVTIVADAQSDGCVRSGDLYAEFDLSERAPFATVEERVTLQRDVTLRVEVVDTLGRPVANKGVEVSHRGFHELDPTDDAGRVVVPHAQDALALNDLLRGEPVSFRVSRRTSDASTETLGQQYLPVERLHHEPTVRLTIPAGGTIVVQAKDADRVAFDRRIWLAGEQGETFDLEPAFEAGAYTFGNVPCGRRWEVVVSDGGMVVGVIDNFRLPLVGPRSEDEIVRVAVDVPTRKWWLRCRVVRNDGRPVENVQIAATSPAFTDEIGDRGARGNQDGVVEHFRVRCQATVTDLAPLTLRIHSPLCRPTTIVIQRPLPSGEHDLGDLVVEPPAGERMLASVDLRSAGRPAPAGGEIRLIVAESERADVVPTWTREVEGIVQLHGVPPNQGMLLACSHPRFLSPPLQPIGVGQHCVVDLQPSASLRVDVLANGLPLDDVRGCLTRVGDEHGDCEHLAASMQAIRWPHLAPGRYSLRLLLGEHVLHESPPFDLTAGDNRWPGDGSRIDLRGRVRVCRINARGGDGARLGTDLLLVEASLGALPPEWDSRLIQAPWFLVPDRPHDVLVRAWRHVPRRLAITGPEVVLRLQPCTRLDWDPLPQECAVRVRILDDAVPDRLLHTFDFHPHGAEFQADDDNELYFAPGTVLELTAMRDGKSGTPQQIVVGTDSPQRVILR